MTATAEVTRASRSDAAATGAAIVVVDDHELLAHTLCIALRHVGQRAAYLVPRGRDTLLAEVLQLHPDLVLLDLDLGRHGDAAELIGPLVDAQIRVLIITGSTDRLRIGAALERGALGYRSKSTGLDDLVEATIAAAGATAPLDATERVALLEELRIARARRQRGLAPFTRLTEREQATLRALGEGRTVQEIARSWVVSEATVRTHVRCVLAKLDVRSQLAAVAAALRAGWLVPPTDSSLAYGIVNPCSTTGPPV